MVDKGIPFTFVVVLLVIRIGIQPYFVTNLSMLYTVISDRNKLVVEFSSYLWQ